MGYFQISAQPSLYLDSLEISLKHRLVIVGMMLQVAGADSLEFYLQCQGASQTIMSLHTAYGSRSCILVLFVYFSILQ